MLLDDLITVATVEAIRLADDLAAVLGDALIDAPKGRFRPWRLSRLLADPAWLSRAPDVRVELTALRDAADPIIRAGTRTEDYLNDSGGLSTSTEVSDDARLWSELWARAQVLDETLANLSALSRAKLVLG